MSDSQFSGDQCTTVVTKVPGEADVGVAKILAGIMELHSKSNTLVLDKVLVILVYIIDLGERYGEGNLV